MKKFLALACFVALGTSAGMASASSPPPPAASGGYIAIDSMSMTVATNGTLVKAQPISSSKTLSTLAMGTKVMVIARTANGMWGQVKMGGMTGYIPVKALK